MGRVYTIPFANVACAAVQDLVSIKAHASTVLKVLEARVSQNSSSTSVQIRVRFKKLPVTATLGSGGNATPAVLKKATGDATMLSTAHTNDTTQATTSGAAITVFEDSFNAQGGGWYPNLPEVVPEISPGEAFVMDFPATPLSANYSGHITVEELGG